MPESLCGRATILTVICAVNRQSQVRLIHPSDAWAHGDGRTDFPASTAGWSSSTVTSPVLPLLIRCVPRRPLMRIKPAPARSPVH
jgi:hypothetical protein